MIALRIRPRMLLRPLPLLLAPALAAVIVATGCQNAPPDPSGNKQPKAVDASASRALQLAAHWQQSMDELGSISTQLDRWLLRRPRGSLQDVAAQARRAAELVREGYGAYEVAQVERFADYARDAERWLLQIAVEAKQGHADIAAEQLRSGRERHCVACHDAVERASRR
ncbi:MAG: hypothetical protein AB8H80_07775 [Planctomycetota bacterium]